MKKPIRKLLKALASILFSLLLVSALAITVPRLFGIHTQPWRSGNMAPVVPAESLVFVFPVPSDEIVEDNIILFYEYQERDSIELRRVVDVMPDPPCFVAMSDAFEDEPPALVPYTDVLGVARFYIPFLGYMARFQIFGISASLFLLGAALPVLLIYWLKKKQPPKKFFRTFALVLCLCVVAVSGYQLYIGQREYDQGEDMYTEVVQGVQGAELQTVMIPAEEPGATPEPIVIPDIDFEVLSQVNVEGLAWIYSPDSKINYPVVQGKDNKYYLNHLIDDKRNRYGTIFLDYRNSPDFSDRNSVMYGHHMRNGSMFAGIELYKEQSYYDAHPYMYLLTKNACYRIELFAGVVRDNSDNVLFFENDAAFLAHVAALREKSTFLSPVQVTVDDRLITLSTCAYDFKNARYILVGRARQFSLDKR